MGFLLELQKQDARDIKYNSDISKLHNRKGVRVVVNLLLLVIPKNPMSQNTEYLDIQGKT